MQKGKIYLLLYTIMVFIIISFIVFFFETLIVPILSNKGSDDYAKEVFESDYKIVIKKKYIDELHHNNVTIVGTDFSGREKVIVGSLLYSKLYEIVSIGDTVIKKGNSNLFYINNHYRKVYKFSIN